MVAERELPPDDARLPTILALPELVADDQSRLAAAPLVVCCREEAAPRGLHTQRMEKVAAHVKHPSRTNFTARSEIDAVRTPGKDSREGLLVLSNLLPNRIGDRRRAADAAPCTFHIRHANFGQFLRGFDRQRAQSHRVD